MNDMLETFILFVLQGVGKILFFKWVLTFSLRRVLCNLGFKGKGADEALVCISYLIRYTSTISQVWCPPQYGEPTLPFVLFWKVCGHHTLFRKIGVFSKWLLPPKYGGGCSTKPDKICTENNRDRMEQQMEY